MTTAPKSCAKSLTPILTGNRKPGTSHVQVLALNGLYHGDTLGAREAQSLHYFSLGLNNRFEFFDRKPWLIKPRIVYVQVLALNGSYHGDTLGAMEAQASTPYTSPLQQPWYRGRGCFLDPPKVELVRGRWRIQWDAAELDTTEYASREEVFGVKRTGTERQAEVYRRYIEETMRKFEEGEGNGERAVRLGGLILEPGKDTNENFYTLASCPLHSCPRRLLSQPPPLKRD